MADEEKQAGMKRDGDNPKNTSEPKPA